MKIKYKKLSTVLWTACILFLLVLPAKAADPQVKIEPAAAEEEKPVAVIFENTSDHTVLAHILSYDIVTATHTLVPGSKVELQVEFGSAVRLEYATPPFKTTLSNMGSRDELNRTVLLKNDGENLFIQEQFSGQRYRGKGKPRNRHATVSDPQDIPEQQKLQKIQPTRKEDPLGPEPKEKIVIEKKEKNLKKESKKEKTDVQHNT
jgi:hypothetical protein